MSFDQLFDGSDAHLLPSNAADCAEKLRQYNRWRRGEDWAPDEDGPNPKELGLLIDYAADALEPKVCCGEFETCIDMCAVRADRFKSQRDGLLAALEKQVADAKHCQRVMCNEVGIGFLDVVTLANSEAAIASVKGGAA